MRAELYSKHDCPLCEVAERILEGLQARYGFELSIRYIDEAPVDYAHFRYDVPVLFLDGVQAMRHHFTVEAVEERLRAGGMRVAQSGDGNGDTAPIRGNSR